MLRSQNGKTVQPLWATIWPFFQMLNVAVSSGFPGGSDGKESACNAGGLGSSLGENIPWRRERLPSPVFLPGELHGHRGAWHATVHGVTKSWTGLSNFHTSLQALILHPLNVL